MHSLFLVSFSCAVVSNIRNILDISVAGTRFIIDYFLECSVIFKVINELHTLQTEKKNLMQVMT